MADTWNVRQSSSELPTNTILCTGQNITQELVERLRKKIVNTSKFVTKNTLWNEMNTMKTVIYKHHNQHRKEKYFKGMKLIQKHLSRLQEMDLGKVLAAFMEILPKKGIPISTLTRYPCYETVQYVLLRFIGASKLAAQAISHCKRTFIHICAQLSHGFFITFHIVTAAALSRMWVLLKDIICNISECYGVLYPWMELVKPNDKDIQQDKTNLPPCLKTWINADLEEPSLDIKNNNLHPTFTPKSSTLLDKLFLFSPQTEKYHQDSPKNPLAGSVVVPRNMFPELNATYDMLPNTASKVSTGKRKGEQLDDFPKQKRPCLDIADTNSNDTETWKEEERNAMTVSGETPKTRDDVTNHKTKREKKKKKKLLVADNNDCELVDSCETPQKMSKKKAKEDKESVIQGKNDSIHDCIVIDSDEEISKKKKRIKHKETSKEFVKGNDSMNIIDGNKAKKNKKKKKDTGREIQRKSSSISSLDILALDQDSPRRTDKKSIDKLPKHKNVNKNAPGKDNEYFDDLFSALGV